MKKHISITIDTEIIKAVRKQATEHHSSVSRVLELAAREYLKANMQQSNAIVSTTASFRGTFSREDTYAGR